MRPTRIALLLILTLTVPFATGCGPWAAGHLLDKMTDNAIKMMEAQAKIEREKRAESYTIEGRFAGLEMQTTEVPETDPSKLQRKQEGNKVTVEAPTRKIKTCIITFMDGREKEFRNVPPRELEPGKRYLITYNGLNEITSIEDKSN